MDVRHVDLNLLTVLEAMLEHQSVTRVANALGMSQPAVSAALAKLREQFNDPLFVRTGNGMKPTPRAMRLASPLQRALGIIDAEVLREPEFNPGASSRTFTVNTPDIGEMVFLPRLLGYLALHAPGVSLRSVALTPAEAEAAMEAGDVDLSVGYFPDLAKGSHFQQRLFRHSFVCMVRANHPVVSGQELSLEQFLALAHAVVQASGRSQELFEREMARHRLKRRVVLRTPHFMSLPMIIAETDLIATVPRAVGLSFSKLANIKTVDLPFSVPAYELRQYWHRLYHKDAGNQWLRGVVHELFKA
ncbi:LysR family transcriptional regulator [Pusillimonas sp.]|uniref:LysR family transcriptional regulator n=1 Tax=Pusillimonas sp. TaxID=3040095 RepID=UPI0037CAFF05